MTELPKFITPAGWSRGSGFSHGIAATGWTIFVAGQVGWDPKTLQFLSDGFAEQAEQALRNVLEVVGAAGASPGDVTRLTWFITDRDAYTAARPALAEAYRRVFGRHFPAMSVVVVAGLIEARALVEIEATAVVAAPSG